jgi:hypothetical protein
VNSFPLLLLFALLAGLPAPAAAAESENSGMVERIEIEEVRSDRAPIFAQMTIEQRVIIRVPMIRPPVPEELRGRMVERTGRDEDAETWSWVEHKGPKCIGLGELRAASVTSARGVDLMLRDRRRMRALLGRDCRPADLYSGFYIQPHADGDLCAGRDRVLARSGANCEITGLKRLVLEPDR